MGPYGITFANESTSCCQTGYVYPTALDALRAATQGLLCGPYTLPTQVDGMADPDEDEDVYCARIEADDDFVCIEICLHGAPTAADLHAWYDEKVLATTV